MSSPRDRPTRSAAAPDRAGDPARWKRRLVRVVPAVGWMSTYRRQDLRGDLVAGLTTAVMLVPQAMAYAMLAGLPPIVGLYASVFPLLVYALFGSSRELAVGPVAMDSLLVASGVGAIAVAGTDEYIGYAVALALMVGVIQLVMGLSRLGFLVNFLSTPVVSGFTSAAALIIGLSQLKHLLGVDLPRSNHVHTILLEAGARVGEIDLPTLAIGLGAILTLIALKRAAPAFPRALLVVVAGTVAVALFGLHEQGVAIVGDVPAGLPSPALPPLSWQTAQTLFPTAMAIALVAFMEAISVASAIARKRKYEVDPNQELVAIGLANVVGGFFRAYPVTGGFSRTAVNAQAGARTPLASMLTAAAVGLAVVFLTPLFYHLPKAVLAGIIMTAVFGLVDVKQVVHLWRVKRTDLALLGVTFFATLGWSIQQGILVGVGASLLVLVFRTTRPHVAVLGRRPNGVYRNIARYDDAVQDPGVLAVRLDAQFYFGNVNYLRTLLRRLEDEAPWPLQAIVIDASGINQIDSSATTALEEILDDYRERGIALYLAALKGPVRDVLGRAGFPAKVGENRLFDRVEDAVPAAAAAASAHGDSPREEEGRPNADPPLLRPRHVHPHVSRA